MIDLILNIYIGINCFIAGYYFRDYSSNDSRNEKLSVVGRSLILLVAAVPLISVLFIWFSLERVVFRPINNTFQINFWLNYIFTNKWKRASQETLYNINEAASKKGYKNYKDRMFKYCVILINDLNNYQHKQTQDEQ